MYSNNKKQTITVAQAVYKLFGKGYPNDTRPKIIYIDGDTTNCAIWNLKICRAYTEERLPEQIARYKNEVKNCVLHIVKDMHLNRYAQLDVDNIIGETYLMIWKHLSQYMPNTSFYVFCKKYFMLVFRRAWEERTRTLDNTISLDENWCRKTEC